MSLRPALAETLDHVARLSDAAGVSPLLFGAGVLELLGIGAFVATDLDLIVTADEARALARAAGIDPGAASGDQRFRSEVHLSLAGAPLVIDVMADLRVNSAQGWQLFAIGAPVRIDVAGRTFRAVSPADLLHFYRLADRAKDRAKIAALEAALVGPAAYSN